MKVRDVQPVEDTDKVNEILSIVSHELKTPITSIKAYAEILEKRLSKKKDSKNIYFLNNINEQADRISLLVNRILDANRLSEGTFFIQPARFDVDDLLDKLITDFQHMINTHQIAYSGKQVGSIDGDPERIREVLINLITNAIKYSPGKDKIEVVKKRNAKLLTISIHDFGIGIPKNKQKQIFAKNFRIDTRSDMANVSSGLGLYIASEIIKLHRGKITVMSKRGEGTVFSVHLPFV